ELARMRARVGEAEDEIVIDQKLGNLLLVVIDDGEAEAGDKVGLEREIKREVDRILADARRDLAKRLLFPVGIAGRHRDNATVDPAGDGFFRARAGILAEGLAKLRVAVDG